MATAAAPSKGSFSHPRRRAASPSMNPDSLLESLANMSIRKGVTFHSPTVNDSELLDPFEASTGRLSIPRSMTSRSTTCPKELEDLLVGAGERRVVDFLARVDQAVNNKSKEQLGSILSEPDVLPVPAFLVERASLSNSIPDQREEENYDSGLGSSVSSEEGTVKIEQDNKSTNKGHRSSRSGSAITRSISSVTSDTESIESTKHLSQFAVEQIHRYLVKPILNEPALKDFHRLIAQVPKRIGDRQITNLRDLEKTLIFLAPDFSRSPAAYLQFCETSIHCLHATVNGVHESDQRLPTDRPYTNHYFLDLVQQIRRYAQILAANRERQANGEEVDDMDITPAPLELRDGMTQTGRPAQLGYRTKDTLISLADNQPLDDVPTSMKRPMADVDDEDAVQRSMARRKKGELPKTYTCPVAECDKEFNRPCDRTKHLKTHERPHKCSEASCEFNTKGFPTEKERDRHWSDRHDANAKTWDCHFKDTDGCPYSSKREHNLKSHMEKAHGWEYVRSKGVKNSSKPAKPLTQAKAKAKVPVRPRVSASASSSSSSPFTLSDGTPANTVHLSAYTSPTSPFSTAIDPSPMESLMDYNPTGFNPDFADHFNSNIYDNSLAPPSFPYTPSLSDGRRPSHVSSMGSTPVMPTPAMQTPAMQGDMCFQDTGFTIPPTPEDLDFSNSLFSKDWNFQVGTPLMPIEDNFAYADNTNYLFGNLGTTGTFEQSFAAQEHPGLRDDPMLTTTQNYSQPVNEGFGTDTTFEGQDFQLDQYLSNTGINEPLFNDSTGFGEMGSQFNLDKPIPDSNPYKHLFPEFDGPSS